MWQRVKQGNDLFSHRSSTADFIGFNVLLPGNFYLRSEVSLGFFSPRNTKIKKKKKKKKIRHFLFETGLRAC